MEHNEQNSPSRSQENDYLISEEHSCFQMQVGSLINVPSFAGP